MDKTIGFIDVGTNSVHMLVVRFYEGSLGTSVYSDKESVRIGQSLYSRGVIDEETIDKARIVISKFAEVAKGWGGGAGGALAHRGRQGGIQPCGPRAGRQGVRRGPPHNPRYGGG